MVARIVMSDGINDTEGIYVPMCRSVRTQWMSGQWMVMVVADKMTIVSSCRYEEQIGVPIYGYR